MAAHSNRPLFLPPFITHPPTYLQVRGRLEFLRNGACLAAEVLPRAPNPDVFSLDGVALGELHESLKDLEWVGGWVGGLGRGEAGGSNGARVHWWVG